MKSWTMMEQRRALTIPFPADKDSLQVSWTEFASCKRRRDSQHKNGSMPFSHDQAAMVVLEMTRRKPRLILEDILKTELGQAHMERMKLRQVSSVWRECVESIEEPLSCGERRSSQRVALSVTRQCDQNDPPPASQRPGLRRRSQNVDYDKDKDVQEVITGKDCKEDDKFAEVVDCGLSVSWEPADSTKGCDDFSPTPIKERWSDPEKEVPNTLKRKIQDVGYKCNGTTSPKRCRESVLRLTGEDGRDGAPAITRICLEDSGEDGDLEGLDNSIVKFTVGADEPTDVLVPVISPNVEAEDSTTKTVPSDPIVLSSDDEENCGVSQHCSPAVHTAVTVEDPLIQGQPQLEAVATQQEAFHTEDMQMLHIAVEELPPVAVSVFPSVEASCLGLAFSILYCGGLQGKSSGDILMEDNELIIALTDDGEQVEVTLTIERKELQRYSVWEQSELEAQGLHFECDGVPPPPAVLMLYVSKPAAAAVQQGLLKLYGSHKIMITGEVSPIILLALRDPLEGMEGAVFRSLLDIDCLHSLEDEESIVPHDVDGVTSFEDIGSPFLSLGDSIELIRRTGLDSHLLSLLGLESTDSILNTGQDSPHSDTDIKAAPLIVEVDPQKGTVLELKPATDGEIGTQLKPEEGQKEQELQDPSEKKKDEPTPVYTLCHCRTKGSFSVSLCKPDSSWTRYKHKGLPHRLIQFPPPPLKGGITVTMEDLQCLDRGQFLNDVIIDFYLKYLLHKASAAVAERSHVFSSFFFKQLTRRDNAREGNFKDSCQRQRRHQRVKTWTRHVDIFKKDFLFVPVNQEAHWYLVVICFPGLDEPNSEAWNESNPQSGQSPSGTGESQDQDLAQGNQSPNDNTENPPTPPTANHSDNAKTETENGQEEFAKDPKPGPVSCTARTYQGKTICKRPCILVMDSLKRSLHERVFKLLRDYLEAEWEVRRGSSREFGHDQMQSSHCRVPLQDNSSDCGLYLLQYVESFLEDPVVHFDLPLHLERWFPRQLVRRKRDEIRDLILNLYRHQNLDSDRDQAGRR